MLLCSSIFVGFSTVLQVWLNFQAETRVIKENVDFIKSSYLPSIADSVYNLDDSQTRLLLHGVRQLRGIEYCEVSYNLGDERFNIADGNPKGVDNVVYEYPIQYQIHTGDLIDVGMLSVSAEYQNYWYHFRHLKPLSIVVNASQIFLIALITLLIFQFFVSRHLSAMAGYAQELSVDNLETVLRLDRRTGPDEIEMVVGAVNDLRERLKLDIESRLRQDIELRHAYDRFSIVMDSLDAAVYVANMETYEVLFANKYLRDLLGDVVGKTCWMELQSDQTGPCPFCSNKKLADDHGNPTGIYLQENQNSLNSRWYECRDQAIRWTDGRVVRLQVATDITDRKKVEAALKESQRTLDSIVRNVPDIIFRLDREEKITFISEAVRKYGRSPESFVGSSIIELVHPEDRPAVEKKILERRSGERRTIDLEVRMSFSPPESDTSSGPAGDKKWAPFYVSSEGLYSEDEASSASYIGAQAIARDISRIKYFEQQIDRLGAVVEQAAEDVVITDPKGVIQYVNPRFEEATGYTLAEVLGKTPRIFKSGKQDDAFYRELWRTIERGEIWKGRIWNRIKSGDLILQDVTISPIFDAKGKLTGYASVRRDITREHRIQEQFQQTQKMEAIGTLAGGIAHDFNNILGGILGFTELSLDEVQDRPSTKQNLEQVLKAGRRATDLVRQILYFSRSQKSEVKPVSPTIIAREVVKLMRASLPSTIEIKTSLDSKRHILADPTNIHQVLMNLCTNAAYAMKQKGGVLSVTLQDVIMGPGDLFHRPDTLPGEYLKISVEDTGTGMTKEVLEKAFDPFFTTKESGEGTGMGLSTVHGIITEIGGFVTLYSEPDRGTAIHIFIPLIPEPDEKTDTGPADVPLQGGTERILFVDDEQVQIDLAESSLVRYGYRITAFSDSTIALAHFQEDPDAYDLVITDMTMPKMTGDVLTQRIHSKRPDIPVIMCTGFSEIIDEQKAKALGIEAFLYKPVIKAKLLETIRKVLDRNR